MQILRLTKGQTCIIPSCEYMMRIGGVDVNMLGVALLRVKMKPDLSRVEVKIDENGRVRQVITE